MLADFYINYSDKKYLNKNLTATEINVSIILKEDTDLLKPTFIVSYSEDFEKSNYIYVRELKKYYYIENKIFSQQRIYLICSCDVLMSNKEDILNLECVIKRQERVFNTYLNDEKFKAYEYSRIQTLEFPNGFDRQAFVLAISGGGD